MDHREKPGTPGDILEHYGVKGMRWGVRKEDVGGDSGGRDPKEVATRNEQTKMYMAAAKKMPPPTPKSAEKSLAENHEKFAQKFAPSEGPRKGPLGKIEVKEPRLTPEQKKTLIYVGGTVAVVGGAYLASRYTQNKLAPWMAMLNEGGDPKKLGLDTWDDVARLAGKPIDPKAYHGLVGYSQSKTWIGGQGYLTEKAFARPSFELPEGHEFFRLSTKAEGTFGGPTYCTASLDDFNRYVSGFRQEKGLSATFHRVTWKSTGSVRVPDLTTVLGQLHGALEDEVKNPNSWYHGDKVTPELVMKEYNAMSGGGWSTDLSKNLISRLKGQGYHALIDEMDAGVIGETPLVLFDTSKATPKKSVKFDTNAIKAAEALLKEIPNPPGRKP